jgi:hypothetical protein
MGDEWLLDGVIIDADEDRVRKVLVCDPCGRELCDVDGSGDTLYLLATRLGEHRPTCARSSLSDEEPVPGTGEVPYWWQRPNGTWMVYYPDLPPW